MVIDEETRNRINDLMKFASEHVVGKKVLEAILKDRIPPIMNDERYCITLSDYYRVSYALEDQFNGFRYKHLSVSVINKDYKELPSPEEVNKIAKEFGMKTVRDREDLWIEYNAVNVLEKIED